MISEKRKVSELREWEKNPRKISADGLERLKKQIRKLGMYKPLIVTEDGEVLGGNMRLKALKEMGYDEVWVSIVKADSDDLKLEYALSDNDRAVDYVEDDLKDLLKDSKIELNDYHVDLGQTVSLSKIIEELDEVKGEVEFTEELYESQNYIVLYFDNDIDWLNLLTIYPLKSVKALDSKGKFEKVGVGRVVKGIDFINKLKK